jgi:chromosome segregation ATPase
MDPLINQLFEEAAGRAQELAEEATEAMHAVGTLAGEAASLKETVASQADEAHRRYQELAAEMEEAEARLQAAAGETSAGLDRLAAHAGGASRERVAALLASVHAGLDRLDELRGRVDAAFHEGMDAAGAGFEQLGGQVGQAAEALQRGSQDASEAISGFQQGAAAAEQEVEEARGELLDAVESASAAAAAQAEAVGEAMGASLAGARDVLVAFRDGLLEAHNEVMVAARAKFTEEAPPAATSALQGVATAADALAGLCAGEQESLEGAAQQVIASVERSVAAAEGLVPVLQAASGLA